MYVKDASDDIQEELLYCNRNCKLHFFAPEKPGAHLFYDVYATTFSEMSDKFSGIL